MQRSHGILASFALFAAALGGLAACSEPTPPPAPPPVFELKSVVAPRLAALEAELAERVPSTPPADAEQLEGLLEMLASSSGSMHELALEEAAALGRGVVVHLAPMLTDEELPLARRAAAIEILGKLDTVRAARLLLVRVENDRDAWVRTQCAWRLGSGTQDWVVPRLVLCLKYEQDHQSAIWIGKTLADFGNYSGLNALLTVWIQTPDAALRASAEGRLAEILERTGFEDPWELRDTWVAGDPEDRLESPKRSRRYELELWKRLARFDEFGLRGVDDSRWIMEGLEEVAATILTEALHEADPKIRVHTTQCLERMGKRASAALDTLIAGLDEAVMAPVAANALGAIGDPRAEEPLLARTDAPTTMGLRLAAVRALGHLDPLDDPGRARLREIFDAADTVELHQAAGEGLLRLGIDAAEVVPKLADLLVSDLVEPVSTEMVLREFLAARAEGGEEASVALLAQWDALQLPTGQTIPTDERLASLTARRDLIRGLELGSESE